MLCQLASVVNWSLCLVMSRSWGVTDVCISSCAMCWRKLRVQGMVGVHALLRIMVGDADSGGLRLPM